MAENNGAEAGRTGGPFPGEQTCGTSQCHNVTPNTGPGSVSILVNGAPIAADPWRRTLDWVPDGVGQMDILVIDAKGTAARSSVFLRRE